MSKPPLLAAVLMAALAAASLAAAFPLDAGHSKIPRGSGSAFAASRATLLAEMVDPASPVNVSTYETLPVTVRVTCAGGDCGNVTAILDPPGTDFLVWEPEPTPLSGQALQATLSALGYAGERASTLAGYNLSAYRSVFVLLGVYPNNYVFPPHSPEEALLVDFLDRGGNLYLEGGDVWAFDFDPRNLKPYFNINGIADGDADLFLVEGVQGTFASGMGFAYAGENEFIDRIAPFPPAAYSILRNPAKNYVIGVAHAAGTYKTIGTSFEFGGLVDSPQGTKLALAREIMEFFGIPPSLKGIIPTSPLATPFSSLDPNPRTRQHLACLGEMGDGDSCLITWTINATAINRETHEVFAIFFPDSPGAEPNMTPPLEITILTTGPVLELVGDREVNENQSLVMDLEASDPNNDTLTFGTNAGDVLPSPFSFTPNTGVFSWTPTFDDAGNYAVLFNVTDGQFSDEETITITVINVPPSIQEAMLTASNGTNTTLEDLSLTIVHGQNTATEITDWRVDGKSVALLNMPFDLRVDGSNATVKDYSTFGINGSLRGPIWTGSGKAGGSYSFDGVDDHIVIPDYRTLNSTEALTLEAWVYWRGEANATDDLQNVVTNGDFRRALRVAEPDHFMGGNRVLSFFTIGGVDIDLYSSARLIPGTWYHIATTYDGSALRIYVNGLEDASAPASGPIKPSELPTFIGTEEADYFFAGLIDEVRIHNRSLNREQLQEHYLAGLSGKHPLVLESHETRRGETWEVAVTPNNQEEEGLAVLSNTLFIVSLPPVLDPIGDKVVNENETLTIRLNASDADNDTLTFLTDAALVLPSAVSLDPLSGLFVWTPTFQDAGEYAVTFSVTDGAFTDSETVVITVNDSVHGVPGFAAERRVTTDPADSMYPSAAFDKEGRLHLAWTDSRDGNAEIYYQKRYRNGSFSSAARLTNDTALSWFPSLAAGGDGNIHVVWVDTRDDNSEIYYTKLDPLGGILVGETRLTDSAADSFWPRLREDSQGNLHLVWVDSRDGNPELYHQKLDAQGANITPATRLTDDPASSLQPSLAVGVNGSLHIAWTDIRDGNAEIYYTRLDSSGATLVDDLRLTSDPADSSFPAITADSLGNLHVAWSDSRDGNAEIYYTKRAPSGGTLIPERRLTVNLQASWFPAIVSGGSDIHLAWMDGRNGNREIYYLQLADFGNHPRSPIRLTSDAADSSLPVIAREPKGIPLQQGSAQLLPAYRAVHILWEDQRDGNRELYHIRSRPELITTR
ncbi:MAG: hypothetical protein HY520_00895 [Candidatus Aenigmarchaeota archaeon]|nr:hypothetical protein [Candidatus Aenigmarchaeota archaeon]